MATAAETIQSPELHRRRDASGDAEHGSEPVLNPATGEQIAHRAAVRREATSTPPCRPPSAPSRMVRDAARASARSRC